MKSPVVSLNNKINMFSKKWLRRYLISVGVIVVLFNFTPIPILIGIEPIMNVYWYENSHGEDIMAMPSKGRYINYTEPGLKRKFQMNYFKFWKWWEYLMHPQKLTVFTSDDVFFQVFADRKDLTKAEYKQAREQFFSKGLLAFELHR